MHICILGMSQLSLSEWLYNKVELGSFIVISIYHDFVSLVGESVQIL